MADPELPEAELLLGGAGGALFEDWLAGAGGTVRTARPRQVLYRPGDWISVVYLAEVEWSDRSGPTEERLVAVADASGQRWGGAGEPVAADLGVRCWAFPDDPLLPSLAQVGDPAFARWLAEGSGLPDGAVTADTAAYRPGRRAVVELSAPARERLVFDPAAGRVEAVVDRPRVYGKVLRPGRAEPVRRRRGDDLASMLGRVWTAGRTASRGRGRAADYADHLFRRFAEAVDPRELCRRTAGVVFGRATGPFRTQQREWPAKAIERIRLAELWLAATPTGEPPT